MLGVGRFYPPWRLRLRAPRPGRLVVWGGTPHLELWFALANSIQPQLEPSFEVFPPRVRASPCGFLRSVGYSVVGQTPPTSCEGLVSAVVGSGGVVLRAWSSDQVLVKGS
jgi:hypothetical protein